MIEIRISDECWLVERGAATRVRWPPEKEGAFAALAPGTVWFQAAIARGEADHVVFFRDRGKPTAPEESDAAVERLRAAVGDGLLAVVDEDHLGWARVSSDESGDPADTAAVVAVIRASWSWDESAVFDVRVEERRFLVTVSFEEGTWRAIALPADPE